MTLVCARCYIAAPCGRDEHDMRPEAWMRVPDGSDQSIPCWVLDHEECTVPIFCKCSCHNERIDEEPPITASPSNR
jgi:hypothetical protein